MRINRYFLSLIRTPYDPIWKQVIPDIAELDDYRDTDKKKKLSFFKKLSFLKDDPLSEEKQSPVPNLIHRYPDRVVFLVSGQCAMFCRYCMRKRKVGNSYAVTDESIKAGLEYIQKNREIRDVILSGGDPLMLDDESVCEILKRVRSIPHVEIIRIHTRIPSAFPMRITHHLAQMLKEFHPLYINTHFNHPDEITDKSAQACSILADAGIPLGCQTVLLKGVNDDPSVMKQLMQKLLMIRVRPYYIHHPDLISGTGHFHPSLETGLSVIQSLRGHISGIGVPQYMIDLPGGGGKIPLLPEYIIEKKPETWLIRNYEGKVFEYPFISHIYASPDAPSQER